MEEFLLRLQESDFGVWVSSAPTLLAYPTILMLHTVGLAMVVGPAAVLDLRLLGVGNRLPLSALSGVFRVMWIGFAINASTGLLSLFRGVMIGVEVDLLGQAHGDCAGPDRDEPVKKAVFGRGTTWTQRHRRWAARGPRRSRLVRGHHGRPADGVYQVAGETHASGLCQLAS
jgi:hypothetical protein